MLSEEVCKRLEEYGEVLISYQDGKMRGAFLRKKDDYFQVTDWLKGEDDEVFLLRNSGENNSDEFRIRKFDEQTLQRWLSHIAGETPCQWGTVHGLEIKSSYNN